MNIEDLKELKMDVANTYTDLVTGFDGFEQREETSPEGLFLISLIDAEIARQSITDEDVQRAIEILTVDRDTMIFDDSNNVWFPKLQDKEIAAYTLAITALEAYQPKLPKGENNG